MTEEDAALIACGRIADLLGGQGFNRIDYDYDKPDLITVFVSSESVRSGIRNLLPSDIAVQEPNSARFVFKIALELGPAADTLIKKVLPGENENAPAPVVPMCGGDPVYVQEIPAWGTAGVFVRALNFEISDHIGNKYVINAVNCFLSNNHVIAGLDTLPPNTPLGVGSKCNVLGNGQGIGSRLCGFVPLSNILMDIDFSVGDRLDAPPKIFRPGELRNIGPINNVWRNPWEKGETIRKSGARTHVTQSETRGRGIINAPGAGGKMRQYRGVYKTGENFSDHGDSGSIVIGDNNDVVGMLAWGIDDGSRVGYFWTFGQQLPFSRYQVGISASI
ncbi:MULTISPECIES: hypothetical protein [Rhizobium]|uniref:Uncharacterized protein n=1 Tax=Rhizobium phaseoli TaxID=396 RepID=A0A7X6F8T3_9HYPH|nr:MULTISPECIES: hypothetical protein [Rhizobium]MDE8763651.1 hypothetical protein [Rhizobium sp. CBK13]NKF14861.1 hypothetical protein [Rhizobium phaseoli]QPK09192.1 hypothetical protein HER27_000995 [Rhizobium phaseoli]